MNTETVEEKIDRITKAVIEMDNVESTQILYSLIGYYSAAITSKRFTDQEKKIAHDFFDQVERVRENMKNVNIAFDDVFVLPVMENGVYILDSKLDGISAAKVIKKVIEKSPGQGIVKFSVEGVPGHGEFISHYLNSVHHIDVKNEYNDLSRVSYLTYLTYFA